MTKKALAIAKDDGVQEKLRVPTWEEIAVLDAELQRRARRPALKLLRTDKVLDGAGQ